MAHSVFRRPISLLAALSLSGGLITISISSAALGQTANWPSNRPVNITAVFPPGGSVDQVARLLAERLTKNTGGQFIVENKVGASGSIGTAAVAKSAPDGHTLAVVFDTHSVNPSLIPSLPFDTLKDLSPITLIGTGAMAITAHPSTPYKDFRQLLDAVKAKPDSISYGSIGTGSLGHLAMVQIGNELGVRWTHIPYKGGGPLKTDALGGHVPIAIGSVFLLSPNVQAGQLRALAVTSLKPDPQMPGVRTVAEQGLKGFEAYSWWGVFGPAGIPKPTVDRIHSEIAKVLRDPEVATKLKDQGMEIIAGGPAELDKFNRSQVERWGKVVRQNKIEAGS
ncbi:MAG: tripartite tricarboxylate transporter substrate binding protein [Betaproteobacteria bacterium]